VPEMGTPGSVGALGERSPRATRRHQLAGALGQDLNSLIIVGWRACPRCCSPIAAGARAGNWRPTNRTIGLEVWVAYRR
jgi:hypothetical protein